MDFNYRLELVHSADTDAAAWLETLRAQGASCRAKTPLRPVGGVSSTASDANHFFKNLLATGEAEELDFWNVRDLSTTAGQMQELRKALDGAGGRAVALLIGGCPWYPFFRGTPAGNLLLTGSGRMSIREPNGREVWTKLGCGNIHKAMYQDGWIYYTNGALWRVKYALPADPAAIPECVWRPESEKGGGVLGFDLAPNGRITLAVNSMDELVEINPQTKKICARFKVNPCGADGKLPPPHAHLRMVHHTAADTYLVACAAAGAAREYDQQGKLIWEQVVPGGFVFDAIRLANGNTLLAHLDAITEYTPEHRKVWSFACSDAPELKLKFLCCVQENVDSDSVAVGTWANGSPAGDCVTAFEVARRNKKILWAHAAREDINMMSALRIQYKN